MSSIVHKGYFHGHDTLPLHGKTCSATDEQTENGSRKTPPTTHSNVRWRIRIRDKKWKPQYNSCYKLSSHGHVEWSTIWQISAYVDVLSNHFTQKYYQVTIDAITFNSGMTFFSYSQLSWTRILQILLSRSVVILTSLPSGTFLIIILLIFTSMHNGLPISNQQHL
jgi:hypothetical protein